MSRFGEQLSDMVWGYGEDLMSTLKSASRSFVEDDEYLLVFIVALGIPCLLVLWAISRYIARAHNRVRYASEYRDTDGTDYVSSSSSSSSGGSSSAENSGEDAVTRRTHRHHRRRHPPPPTMDEVVQAAAQLTEQETVRRRRSRNRAARVAADGNARDGELDGKDD
ncbi:hypothetical protein NESM_000740000 [Novymonas esmeraldas]|uniref:Uncharacterized protein n=1 Tax=Novymonas esmeraldas TaxID=1808958 RepID=A0AAW0EY90_9TRYP